MPAIDRVPPLGRDRDPDQGLIVAGSARRVSLTRMSRSRQITGALTMLTRRELRRQQPGQRGRGQRLDVELGDRALVFDRRPRVMPVSVSCPAKLPSCSASFM